MLVQLYDPSCLHLKMLNQVQLLQGRFLMAVSATMAPKLRRERPGQLVALRM
jgi:hypothetical protein